jgi:3',5'-cyclic AMP phosphodiesterase CpdA
VLLLHLSDIHFRKGEVGTAMDPNAHLRNELLRDAVAQCQKIGATPEAVLVSGDIAFGGDVDEYAYALDQLDKLCTQCGTTLSAVFSASMEIREVLVVAPVSATRRFRPTRCHSPEC